MSAPVSTVVAQLQALLAVTLPPGTVILDRLAVENGQSLEGRRPDVFGYTRWDVLSGAVTIVDGWAVGNRDGGSSLAVIETSNANVVITCTMKHELYNTNVPALVARQTDATHRIEAAIDAQAGTLTIATQNGVTYTEIASIPFASVANVEYPATLTLDGDDITFTVGDVSVVAISSFNLTATKHGITAEGGGFNNRYWRDFSVRSI